MRQRIFLTFFLSVALAAGLLAAETQPPQVRWQFNVPVRLRDGVTLAAHVFLPLKEGRYPVIVIRSPYGKEVFQGDAVFFAERGYVVVVQDTRGRYDSEGEWYAFRNEAKDGHDTIEWAATQPWSNGKVVTYGGSYGAIEQWLAATQGSKHLAAMAVLMGSADLYAGTFFSGGALQNGTALWWAVAQGRRTPLTEGMKLIPWPELFLRLPVESAPAAAGFEPKFYRDWIDHPARDAYWQSMSWQHVYTKLSIPVLHVGGWFDIFQKGTIENFVKMTGQAPSAARAGQRLIMGPWTHGGLGPKVGEVDFGPQSVVDFRAKVFRWLDHYIRGEQNGADRDPPVEIFVMGVNQWRTEKTWPPAEAKPSKYFLHSQGRANTLDGDGLLSLAGPGDEVVDQFDYDPANPVPTSGGGSCCAPQLIPWGPQDQRNVEKRNDVLVYTTASLERDLEVTGPVEVHLFASTSARDTDWTAKLVDVAPDGLAISLTDGILRARYRNSLERPELLAPGKVYEFVIDAENTSNVFLKGHRIRLEISSSNFPRFSRNTNTGNHPEKDSTFAVAHQTIYHDRTRPSSVSLSVRTSR